MSEPVVERPDMSAYGVPTDDPSGLLPWRWAEERLVASRNYWLVTASHEGRPHAMPVWGVWMADRAEFWFSCAPSSRKAANLVSNRHVVVAADDTVEVVSVEGVADVPAGPALDAVIDEVARAYAEKYESDPDKRAALAGFFREHAVYRVVPERAFGIIEREEDFSRAATRWRWPA